MSVSFFPSDILIMISSLLDNKSTSRLMRTGKSLKSHGDVHGYLTSLNCDLAMDMMKFMKLFSIHSNTLLSVQLRGVDDAHLWLPFYTERICFDHCVITRRINPGIQPQVKSLKITDYHRYKFKTVVKINWECFPNLEELELYVYDFVRTGLNFSQLKVQKINTYTEKTMRIM